eukprot:8262625-Lingulodinium_polyedra.AAC.1
MAQTMRIYEVLNPTHNARLTTWCLHEQCLVQPARRTHWRQWGDVLIGPPERPEATEGPGPQIRLTACQMQWYVWTET